MGAPSGKDFGSTLWSRKVAATASWRKESRHCSLGFIHRGRRVAYKVPRVVESLRNAVERGVDVRVVLEVEEKGGGKVSFSAFAAMGDAVPGARLYLWPPEVRQRDQQGRYGSLHAKCAVADGELALVSSANLTEYALELNMELGVLVRGGSVPRRILEHFDDLMRMGILLERPK